MEVEKSVKPATCSTIVVGEEICTWTMLSRHESVPGEEGFEFFVRERKTGTGADQKKIRHKRL